MSFNPNPGRKELVASAGQTVFTFDFKIFLNTDIQVFLTPSGQIADDTTDILILTTDYTVAITGDSGGTITLVVPASIGDSVTMVRALPITRYIEFQNNGDLLASTLNLDQDYQAYLIADKEADNTRFLKIPESAQGIETTIPPPTPLNFFQWNATGTAIVNVSTLLADGYVWTAGDVYTKTETYSQTEVDALVDINGYTEKTTPVDADELAIADSATTFSLKKLTWANLKATLKTYFDTLYGSITWVANDARAKTALNATGDAPIYACRAWVNFDGTGTVAIRASGNVSSITDNGTGDYTVNFATAMPDDAYAYSGGCNYSTTTIAGIISRNSTAIKTITSLQFYTVNSTVSTAVDVSDVAINIFR